MTKYKAVVEYDGSMYHGWQWQPQLPTIQGKLEEALAKIQRQSVRVHGAGRTDAGVHACGQVAHFEINWVHTTRELEKACNALLPPDILIRHIMPVSPDFHARHSALAKVYVYRILNQPLRSCFWRNYAWHVKQPLDLALMNQTAHYLQGVHDFASFGCPTDGTESTIREIHEAFWEMDFSSGLLQFRIKGSGFLRYMVRCLVGTMVLVGQKKMSVRDFQVVLNSCDGSKSGPTAPPHGLYLIKVEYPESYNEAR